MQAQIRNHISIPIRTLSKADLDNLGQAASNYGTDIAGFAAALLKVRAAAPNERKGTVPDDRKRQAINVPIGMFSKADMDHLRKAAAVRGTDLSGLVVAILKVCASEPTIVDAILDDREGQ